MRRLLILVTALTMSLVGIAYATPKDDWPNINGELKINKDDLDMTIEGGPKNDELLGGHGDDVIYGRGKHDVIWGDHKATGNTKRQTDTIYGGPGKDWIYASHGRNIISGGAGDDILYVSRTKNKKVKRRNCERVSHKSARDAVHDRDGLYD